MEFFRVYGRVIGLLRDERGLAIMLAFANVAVAALQFYEPVLFGRVVDLLSNARNQTNEALWHDARALLMLWAAVGIGGIIANIVVSLQADRMAHRRRLGAMAHYFEHVLVLPLAHPLAKKDRISLEDLAAEPIITYHPSFTGRTRIDHAFAQRKLEPRIALEAIHSDVIKTYVRLGLGIGIVAEMAVRDDGSNSDLAVRPLGSLFGQNVARVAFKRSAYLRNFVYKFAELLSDRLDRNLIAKAMTGHVNDYEL